MDSRLFPVTVTVVQTEGADSRWPSTSAPLAPADAAPDRIAVCVLTFRRAGPLKRLMSGLSALRIPDNSSVKMVVVDNDPDGSGRPVVEAADLPFPVTYVVEPVPGIVAARNTAVSAATPFDFVAFIDDDEVPSAGWLDQLMTVQRSTSAGVVTGTVVADFEQTPPTWMLDGGFFDRPRHGDGELIDYARTSNVLIRYDVLTSHWPPFDAAYGLSGGEDTHFFMRAALEGTRIAWADRAVVTEIFPPERVSWRWLLAREYRRGNTLSLCLRDLTDSRVRRIRRVVHGSSRLAKGLFKAAVARRDRIAMLRAGREMALGAGMLTGLVGARFTPYRSGHRSGSLDQQSGLMETDRR